MSRLFWITFAAAMGLYVLMSVWSAPFLSQEAAGQRMFDMRPMGYSYDAAVSFLRALSGPGRDFYLGVQHRLDLVYPALLGLSFVAAFLWALTSRLRWGLVGVAIVGAVADYAENFHVARMLRAGVDGLTPQMVATASLFTQVKSIAVTICFMALIGLALRSLWRRR
ncbi:hypothetical protein [Thalassovita sp.]|uniref:hypothetical protein n=1 Tax=Thalassovita sp. TaxID=1979401 RepID=UPI002881E84D|nr:hypothetical protein [Thalassovita sp.]MDF1804264.1 hypothetical protein [Thalassovita sp.]